MPSSTVTLGFRPGDFFYNTMDTKKNADLLATFPFGQDAESKKKLIEWANNKGNTHITSITDIFDPQISKIILNPEYDFPNTFLPGNMTFNSNFDALAMSFAGAAGGPGNPLKPESSIINGNIVLSSDGGAGSLVLPVNDGDINWKQDATNSWQPDFDIKAKLSKEIPFVDSDGGISSIIVTTKNPRCKYRKTCTMNHWHYSGGCTTQIVKSKDGETYCKCVCTGIPVFNDQSIEPHSHCDGYTINEDGTATTAVGTSVAPVGLGLIATVKNIKMNLTAQFPQAKFGIGASGGNVQMDFADADDLKAGDEKIRKLVFNYYYYVDENRDLQKKVQETGVKDSTMKQALLDATVQYKNEYLNVFNIVVGIFGVAGYIYLMANTPKPSI